MASSKSLSATHTLSLHDTHVLSSILNPESHPSTTPIDPSLSPLPDIPPARLITLQNLEFSIIRPLGKPSPSHLDIQTAIASLTGLISSHPDYASAYNNRAQAIRMLLGNDLNNKDLSKTTL